MNAFTKPETVGVPGWQTGTKALCLCSQFPQGTDLADSSLDEVECTPYHVVCGMHCTPSSVSVAMLLFSIKTLHLLLSARAEPVEDDSPLYK